jgi:adenine-specific DNA-methyltransferase
MDKLKLHTPDLTAANIEKLAALFPGCVTEARDENGVLTQAIDFDQLRQELSDHIVEGPRERYHLDWPGKREALLAANAPIAKTLRPCREESVNFDTTKNLFIEGDNLDALKLLQETYLGKVKVIYIDPPYNTGNDFIYDDDFAVEKKSFEKKSGKRDEEGRLLIDEQHWKQNLASNARFHSEWISMIYSRLRLASNLLTDDGVILISIDDNEIHNLRKVCDEIFGAENFVGNFIWDGGRKNDSRLISSSHDYIAVYSKSVAHLLDNGVRWRERKQGLEPIYQKTSELLAQHGADHNAASKALQKWYASLPIDHPSREHSHYKLIDAGGAWYGDNISSPNYRENLIFDYKGFSPPNNGWRYDRASMERLDKEGLLYFPSEITQRIQYKRYHECPVISQTTSSGCNLVTPRN